MKQLLFNMTTSEKRAALVNHGQLVEVMLERPNAYPKAGNIYVGRVVKVLPGMQAAFVDVGFEQNGFIHATDLVPKSGKENQTISEKIHEGQWIIVQVKKEASKSKGPLLTENITIPGEHLVYLPFGNYTAVSKKLSEDDTERMRKVGDELTAGCEGLIMRTSSSEVSLEQLDQEVSRLRQQWETLSDRAETLKRTSLLFEGNTLIERALVHTSNEEMTYIFDDFDVYRSFKNKYPNFSEKTYLYKGTENLFSHHNIEQAIHKALQPVVWLKNGGYINIDPTEALTVIDVNTGKFTGKQDRDESILETNLHAAEEAARQLRLRNISGMIVIDFIRMNSKDHQEKVIRRLENTFNQDPIRTRIHGFTALGLLELTRQKVKDSLSAQMTEPCAVCNANHRQLSVETIYYALERALFEHRHTEGEGIWVEVSKPLREYLKAPESDLEDDLSSLISAKLYITEKSEVDHPYFHVRQIGSCDVIETRIEKE
ncbi:Rne/Rng family ribonuclease [Pseudalkalibacillus sp. R45]|uniref:Rne/Rng family ribonuclease n=1 Tax=Pseudalkalibacillus sp. R45 TaxID=3457433 RepID=UPI003FCD3F46